VATVREWADAYLAQARADLRSAEALVRGGVVPSTFAMLLQMIFEKLAKAALLRSGAVTVAWAQSTHAAASRMVQVMRLQRGLIASLGGPWPWTRVLSVVDALEKAHPAIAARTQAPQLEYPWETPAGAIQWPARDLTIANSLGSPLSRLGNEVLRFALLLDRHFNQIFP